MKIDIYNIQLTKIYEFFFIALFISYLFITAGIDVENRRIEKPVSIYGIAISLLYIAYLCIVEKASIYRYTIYIVFYIFVLILDTISLKKFAKNRYINGVLFLLITIAIFTSEYALVYTISMTLLVIGLYILFSKIKQARKKNLKTEIKIWKKINVGFLLCVSNIITIISILIYQYIKFQ